MEGLLAALPGIAQTGFSLFNAFSGKSKRQKKAESVARRNVRAGRAMSVLQSSSGLTDNATWNDLGSKMVGMMQTGACGSSSIFEGPSDCSNAIAETIIKGGKEFATSARTAIKATPSSSIIEKRGGQISWTNIGDSLDKAFEKAEAENLWLKFAPPAKDLTEVISTGFIAPNPFFVPQPSAPFVPRPTAREPMIIGLSPDRTVILGVVGFGILLFLTLFRR